MRPVARLLVTSIIFAAAASAFAAPGTDSGTPDLFTTIHKLDSELFDAFNRCSDPSELARNETFFAPELEFYHDNAGVTWSRDSMIANTRQNACGKYTRELVEHTFAVSPIHDFGAISTGTHRFCQIATGSCDGEAEFVMVWRNQGGQWVVTRALSFAHRPSPAATDYSAKLAERAIAPVLRQHHVPSISFAVIDEGALQYAQAIGDARNGMPATPATCYNIASLAKPLSAEVALQLASLGKLTLDESMSRYWTDPDLATDPRRKQLTPRLALGHKTGFPNWRAGTLRFERDPGTAFGYSGEGFEYLARFIRNKTGKSIDAWAGSLVFTPNGMSNTTYTRQAWLDGRIALPHDAQGSALAPTLRDAAVASDDVYSTPSDYAQFLIGAMNGRGLSPALREERAAVFADRRADLCRKLTPEHCPAEAGMGLGWESFLIDGQRYLMHTGADDGTFTFAYFSPDTRTGLVIFTNSSNGAKTVLPLLRLVGNDLAFIDFLDRLVGAPQGGE